MSALVVDQISNRTRSERPHSAYFVEKVGVDLTFVASLIVAAGLLLRPIPWAAGLEGALHAQIIS
jgi:hypothetical protein